MRFGCRAHDFGRMEADTLAARLAARHIDCVQLAPDKAIACGGGGALAEAAAIGAAFRRQGVGVAVIGCYINPIHPDLAERDRLLSTFERHLESATALGCDLVALETGSVNADYSPHPYNQTEAAFDDMVRSIARLVEAAERFGVRVGVEAVVAHTASTPRKMRRLLDLVASDSLAVVYDPVNLLDAGNRQHQAALFAKALELFGDRIAAVHAKDFIVEADGFLRFAALGRGGGLDLEAAYGWLRRHPGVPLLLEEVGEASVADALAAAQAVVGRPE